MRLYKTQIVLAIYRKTISWVRWATIVHLNWSNERFIFGHLMDTKYTIYLTYHKAWPQLQKLSFVTIKTTFCLLDMTIYVKQFVLSFQKKQLEINVSPPACKQQKQIAANLQIAYLPPEDWEGLSTCLAYVTRTPWAGGRVCGVARTGGKPEGSGPGPEPWLLAPDGPCTHDFIQQTTTWSPHGRGPCLTVKTFQH